MTQSLVPAGMLTGVQAYSAKLNDIAGLSLTQGDVLWRDGTWVLPADKAWAAIREQREPLLEGSDWTRSDDAPLSAEQRAAWAIYRQALRDITQQADPEAIVWPVAP